MHLRLYGRQIFSLKYFKIVPALKYFKVSSCIGVKRHTNSTSGISQVLKVCHYVPQQALEDSYFQLLAAGRADKILLWQIALFLSRKVCKWKVCSQRSFWRTLAKLYFWLGHRMNYATLGQSFNLLEPHLKIGIIPYFHDSKIYISPIFYYP